ncbi:signal transduction histidine kinase [Nonomuraea muscovyensis]|uniref:histidine kinase n=1 Tax=Nonomuraea muscovyensis TaxID=1124761 RepID=A0A7X0BXA6_9ACTN|nr:sensor histidine kinase [Nonomuraea muscovyensis]MBB6344649.1 signal transduction histidine kinase [Nonomuraea muscovyensis]
MNEPYPLFARHLSRGQLVALDVLAGLVFSLLILTAVRPVAGLPLGSLVISLGLGLPLALRRLWPVPIFCVTLVASIAAVVLGSVTFAYVAPAYALYIVALADGRGAWVPTTAIAGLTLITVIGLVTMGGSPQGGAPVWMADLDVPLLGIAALGGAWTIGRAVRERRLYAARDADRLAEQAVTEERLRIARELHDVVAHSVGMIAVKAGVANHVLRTRPEEAHDALRVIETVSRSALVEMRQLLGVLRSADTPDRGPAPDLDGIWQLAERARLAGVKVELDVRLTPDNDGRTGVQDGAVKAGVRDGGVKAGPGPDGDGPRGTGSGERERGRPEGEGTGRGRRAGERLPEGLELSVYRIVQEALTNVVKHAAPARCRVSVVTDAREVRIEVTDDGPGRRTTPATGAGHGLIGMRERVMTFGGVFEAGALPGRGFRVSATLPYRGVS